MSKKSDHPRKGLINIRNIDDSECFNWCLVRYLHPACYNPRRRIKSDWDFAKKFDSKGIKFPLKVRDIHKIEKKNSISSSVLVMKIRKNIQFVYQEIFFEKNVDLLSIWEGKRHCVFINDFSTVMCDCALQRGKEHFCCYCLQAFSTEEILKRYNALKLMENKGLKCPKRSIH